MSVQIFIKKQGGFLEKSIACQSCGHWSLTERSLSRWSLDLSSRWCALIELFLGVGVGSRIALYRYRTHAITTVGAVKRAVLTQRRETLKVVFFPAAGPANAP